jgi:DNA-binding XRE family transcriptional regulator
MLKVRTLREERGLTREQVAVGAKVSYKTIQNAESGYDVRASTLLSLARFFAVAVDDLFTDDAA